MSSELTYQQNPAQKDSASTKLNPGSKKGKPTEGKITDIIGAGDNAKYSLAFVTLCCGFGLGFLITLGLYLKLTLGNDCYTSFIEDTKLVWSIFIPLITLALGYAFGKEK